MKIVREPTLVFLILCLTLILLFFSSSPSLSQHHSLLVSKFITFAKPSHLFMFFAVNFIVIAIKFGGSKPPSGDFNQFFSLPPLVYHEVEYEEEKVEDEDYDDYNKDDFVPCLVHIEYKEEEAKDDYDDDNNNKDRDGCHNYDGCDEDNNDDDGNESDVNGEDEEDDDLETKIDDFIAKTYKKWREELLHD